MQVEINGQIYNTGDYVLFSNSQDYELVPGRIFEHSSDLFVANNNSAGAGIEFSPYTSEFRYSWCIGEINNNAVAAIQPLKLKNRKAPVVRARKIRTGILIARSQPQAVKEAIEYIKTCPYKGTALKVELEGQLDREDYYSESDCENFIMSHVPKEVRDHTIFHRFYYDGSVDSEFTVTVPIEHPEYIIEYFNSWNKLVKEIGNGCETDGAGLHTTILNTPDGHYPGGSLKSACNINFINGMTPLLPALYCLASCDHRSRELSFRHPRIASDKCNAISTHNATCYEFRIFETCYKYPERFYDYFCTIANCLQFYSPKPRVPYFKGTIGELGMPEGYNLGRFYYTYNHAKALNLGLQILKPSYKSIETIKKERNLKLSIAKMYREEKALELEWKKEYISTIEIRRKNRKHFFNTQKTGYKRYLQSNLREIEHYSLRYGNPGDVLSVIGQRFAPTLEVIGDKELALKELEKITPYEKWRQDNRRYAPPLAPRHEKQYLNEKKKSYYCKGQVVIV